MCPYPKRKKFPSQIKYEQNNPTITFRMKKHEKEMIQRMAKESELSISELIRIALLDLEKGFSEINNKFYYRRYNQGHKDGFKEGHEKGNTDGYNRGMNEWKIWVYCFNCWKSIYIKPNSENHERVIEEMRGRLSHDKCPQE